MKQYVIGLVSGLLFAASVAIAHPAMNGTPHSTDTHADLHILYSALAEAMVTVTEASTTMRRCNTQLKECQRKCK
jgi:hypothetical protein